MRRSDYGRAELLLRPNFKSSGAAMLFWPDGLHCYGRWRKVGNAAALPYQL
jgi:hypothetical protein